MLGIGLGLLGVGAVGNFIRSWKTDENFHDAKAKNRKANRIIEQSIDDLETASKKAEAEQQKLLDVKREAYDTLKRFVEIFKKINDVRFYESNLDEIKVKSLQAKDFAMLREIKFDGTIVDTTTIGDAAGMLSLFLPVGIGSFGSFSSWKESQAALAEAEANVYEAQCMAREIESSILVIDAIGERAKLLSDVLSGIYTCWFKNATKELERLVRSKNSIKYYFLERDGHSIYSDEEYEFIATLAALSKTVKAIIDAKIFDDEERENQELVDNPQIKKLATDLDKQIKKDESFGLKETYCAALLQGEIKSEELVRPSDYFVDDFEGTYVRLEQEGYESICKFEDYICSNKTSDSEEIRKRYLMICESLLLDEQYRKLKEKIVRAEEKFKNGYGYKALCTFKNTLEQSIDQSREKDNLIVYLEEKQSNALGKKGKPKYKQKGFAGLKQWVHICLFELSGRRNENIIELGKTLSTNAIDNGYRNKMFNKLPTQSYYEEKMRQAKPLDCLIMTVIYVIGMITTVYLESITWDGGVLLTCLYLMFVISNRKENGILRIIQLLSCYGTAGIGGYIFYSNAEIIVCRDNFIVVNGVVLAITLIMIVLIIERREFKNLYLSRVLWIIPITNYMLFAFWVIQKLTEFRYGLIFVTCFEVIALLISLYGVSKKENLHFSQLYSKNDKALRAICVMLIPVGTVAIIISKELMTVAGWGEILLLIFSVIAGFFAASIAVVSPKGVINVIGLILITGIGYVVGLLIYGLLHCVLPLGNILSLIISELIYLAIIVFFGLALIEEESLAKIT